MFYVNAQKSEHSQYTLLFYTHAYWLAWVKHAHWRMFCVHAHCHYRGVKQDSVPYMIKIIHTHIPIEFEVVDPILFWFLNSYG